MLFRAVFFWPLPAGVSDRLRHLVGRLRDFKEELCSAWAAVLVREVHFED